MQANCNKKKHVKNLYLGFIRPNSVKDFDESLDLSKNIFR